MEKREDFVVVFSLEVTEDRRRGGGRRAGEERVSARKIVF